MIGRDDLLRPIHGRVDFDKYVIELDTRAIETEERQRYTLAHELGHVVLHGASLACGEQVFSMYRVSSERRLSRDRDPRQARLREDEAERFAGHLLMPQQAVRAHFRRLFNKDRFPASSHTVLRRFSLPTSITSRPIEVRMQLAERVAIFHDDGMVSLADFFGVSKTAMGRRLRELGLVV
jgi:Zn-dependent peptidase ImmA (M78 family)